MWAIIGWLNLYQSGTLHRNVSMVHVVLGEKTEGVPFKLKMPASSPNVDIDKLIKKVARNYPKRFEDFRFEGPVRIERWAEKIEGLVKQAGLDTETRAYLCEDDYSIKWSELVANPREVFPRTLGEIFQIL